MGSVVVEILKFLFTTTEGHTLIALVAGWLGLRKSSDKRRLEQALDIARDVFWLVEDWASGRKPKVSSEEKTRVAEGQLRYRLESLGIKPSSKVIGAAKLLWKHLGWAEKASRRGKGATP